MLANFRGVLYRKAILPQAYRFFSIKPVGLYPGVTPDASVPTVCAEMPPEDDLELAVVHAYEEHATGLFRYAVVLVRHREAAQDAVQEVFLRYFIARSQGQRIVSPKAWLYRVLRNYALDSLKSSSIKREIGMEEVRQAVDIGQNPEVSYHHRELARRMSSLLAPRELECLRLRNEGFGYEEIAAILSVRAGTVAALLARGQKKIRKALNQPAPALAARWAENPC
jgi:RNA polymerase sigma-70 factor (ECF subfamily)